MIGLKLPHTPFPRNLFSQVSNGLYGINYLHICGINGLNGLNGPYGHKCSMQSDVELESLKLFKLFFLS
jgi:hypothetical protein